MPPQCLAFGLQNAGRDLGEGRITQLHTSGDAVLIQQVGSVELHGIAECPAKALRGRTEGSLADRVFFPILKYEASGDEQRSLVVEVTRRFLRVHGRETAAQLERDHVPQGVDTDADDLLDQLVAEEVFLGDHAAPVDFDEGVRKPTET